jgi:hypothetical protein
MNLLKDYLLRCGIPNVRLFFWSGRANLNAIDEAGDNLSKELVNWFLTENAKTGQSLRVFAKSSGGLVFRSALRHLDNSSVHLPIDVLLQVAVPNPVVTESTICSVKKIENLYSSSDWLLRFFLTVGPYKGYKQTLAKVNRPESCNYIHNIEIPAVGHSGFNWNTLLRSGRWAGKNLYEIYYEILSE